MTGALLLVTAVVFAIGAVMVAASRPGWSQTGFILEAVAAVIAAVVLVAQRL